MKVFGFEQTYMYEILVTGPLCTSECASECRFSANLCKRALDVTAGVIVQATRNADILTINAKMPSKCLRRCKCEWEDDERTHEDFFCQF